jgi:hypothetical protein
MVLKLKDRNMKKIFSILLTLLVLTSCSNFDIDYPDYDFTAGYFPYQFPVRTLVLGDYIYDNTNDNAHKFVVSVAMGGVYENNRDREFQIEVDESLCNNILFRAGGNAIKPLPSNYYTLSSNSKIVIPKGRLNGGIEVQLTEAFFNDPLAIQLGYVVPIRLKGSIDVDKILTGSSDNVNADLRVASDWVVAPKNFTMFAIKYINEYHGTYFHYGSSRVKDAENTVLENNTYSATYVEQNSTSKLVTIGKNKVSLSTFTKSEVMKSEINMVLTFNGNNCTITAAEGSEYTITGTGVFKSKEYSWGTKARDGITLNFTVSDGTHTYEANDVLVIRDRGVVMELFSPVVL